MTYTDVDGRRRTPTDSWKTTLNLTPSVVQLSSNFAWLQMKTCSIELCIYFLLLEYSILYRLLIWVREWDFDPVGQNFRFWVFIIFRCNNIFVTCSQNLKEKYWKFTNLWYFENTRCRTIYSQISQKRILVLNQSFTINTENVYFMKPKERELFTCLLHAFICWNKHTKYPDSSNDLQSSNTVLFRLTQFPRKQYIRYIFE